jgi:hypothetical protein
MDEVDVRVRAYCLAQVFVQLFAELLFAEIGESKTRYRELLRQQLVMREIVEGGQQKTPREVARDAEDDQNARAGGSRFGPVFTFMPGSSCTHAAVRRRMRREKVSKKSFQPSAISHQLAPKKAES